VKGVILAGGSGSRLAPAGRGPRTSTCSTSGVAVMDGDRVAQIVEKPASPPSHAVTGVCSYDRQVRDDTADPDEYGIPWDDPCVSHLWSTDAPIVSARNGAG
jgi:dTDP-glucose pyrophosphorylase